MKKSIRRILLPLFFLPILYGCSINDTEIINSIPVKTILITKGLMQNDIKFSGKANAEKKVYVYPEMIGKVTDAYFKIGDFINKGDILYTLDDVEIKNNINILEKQLTQSKVLLDIAKENVKQAQGSSYEKNLLELSSSLKNAEINYYFSEKAFHNSLYLYESNKINISEYQKSLLAYEQAETALESSQKALDLYKEKLSKDAITLSLQNLEQAKASYETLKVQLENTKSMLNKTIIKSPISGFITAKNINPGEMVSTNLLPYSISNIDTIFIEVNVTENIINKLKLGDRVDILINSIEQNNFIGIIDGINPSANERSSLYPVRIKINNSNHYIKPGMYAEVSFVTYKKNAIKIPKESIININNTSFVFINNNSIAKKKNVITGLEKDNYVEIKEGLSVGEELIIEGQTYLNDEANIYISNLKEMKN